MARSRARESGKSLLRIVQTRDDVNKVCFDKCLEGEDEYAQDAVDATNAEEIDELIIPMSEISNLSNIDLENHVIYENNVLDIVEDDTFKTIERRLRRMSPKDIFFVHNQPYSLLSWIQRIHPASNTQENIVTLPKRVFMFYPPDYKFVYVVKNPLQYRKFQVGLVCILSIFALMSW